MSHYFFTGVYLLHRHSTSERDEPLQWRKNERYGVSNHRRLECLLNRCCSRADQRKRQSSASLLTFVRGIHRWPVDSPNNAVTQKMLPFGDVIMIITVTHRVMSDRGSHITSDCSICLTISWGVQNFALLALCVRGIHRWPVDSPHKWPATWEIFPCHNVILTQP